MCFYFVTRVCEESRLHVRPTDHIFRVRGTSKRRNYGQHASKARGRVRGNGQPGPRLYFRNSLLRPAECEHTIKRTAQRHDAEADVHFKRPTAIDGPESYEIITQRARRKTYVHSSSLRLAITQK